MSAMSVCAAPERPATRGGEVSNLREAAQQALEALEDVDGLITALLGGLLGSPDADAPGAKVQTAIAALRAALEQDEKPVAKIRTWHKGGEQNAELWDWDDGIETLPDGEHLLYASAPLRAALAQQAEPVQEPVAWRYQDARGNYRYRGYVQGFDKDYSRLRPVALYTAPPQRKPLTDAEIVEAVREADLDWQAGWTLDEHEPNRFTTLARAIERAHGIGEGE